MSTWRSRGSFAMGLSAVRGAGRPASFVGPSAGGGVAGGVSSAAATPAFVAGRTRAYVYDPPPTARAAGVYLVLPGLHFLGPDDPRLDRFCRALAASGFVVVAPFIRAYNRMLLDPSSFDDAEAALALAS